MNIEPLTLKTTDSSSSSFRAALPAFRCNCLKGFKGPKCEGKCEKVKIPVDVIFLVDGSASLFSQRLAMQRGTVYTILERDNVFFSSITNRHKTLCCYSNSVQQSPSIATSYLHASSHLYKRVCPLVRPSVRPSVGIPWLTDSIEVIHVAN